METSASFYYETYGEAVEEVRRRKSSSEREHMIHRIMNSPYANGYVVRSIDAELYCELLTEGSLPALGLGLGSWPKGTPGR